MKLRERLGTTLRHYLRKIGIGRFEIVGPGSSPGIEQNECEFGESSLCRLREVGSRLRVISPRDGRHSKRESRRTVVRFLFDDALRKLGRTPNIARRRR